MVAALFNPVCLVNKENIKLILCSTAWYKPVKVGEHDLGAPADELLKPIGERLRFAAEEYILLSHCCLREEVDGYHRFPGTGTAVHYNDRLRTVPGGSPDVSPYQVLGYQLFIQQ